MLCIQKVMSRGALSGSKAAIYNFRGEQAGRLLGLSGPGSSWGRERRCVAVQCVRHVRVDERSMAVQRNVVWCDASSDATVKFLVDIFHHSL